MIRDCARQQVTWVPIQSKNWSKKNIQPVTVAVVEHGSWLTKTPKRVQIGASRELSDLASCQRITSEVRHVTRASLDSLLIHLTIAFRLISRRASPSEADPTRYRVIMGTIGIPVKLIHEAVGHVITVELKGGAAYRGTLYDGK